MTGIPYRRSEEGSHSWVNLVDNPEQIELLPEPNREPVLKQCLIDLNGPGSNLTTIGCECWDASQSYGDFEHHRFGAYVATHFREDNFGRNAEDCFVVFFRMAQALRQLPPPEPGSVHIVLTLKQFGYVESDRQGWQMELTVVCTWNKPPSAKALWNYWFPVAVTSLKSACLSLEPFNHSLAGEPVATGTEVSSVEARNSTRVEEIQ